MNSKNPTRLAAVAIIAAGSAFSAFGQGSTVPPHGPMTFSGFDRDGDGIVTEEEFDQVRAERRASRAAAGAPMRGAANAPSFNDFDLNGDGRLAPEEFASVQQSRRQGGPGMGMGPGYGRGGGGGMGRGMGMKMPAFGEFDLNGDGSITEQEFGEARANRIAERSQQGYLMRNLPKAPTFAEVDRDDDGLVDREEFARAQSEHQRERIGNQ